MWCHILVFGMPVLGLGLFLVVPWGQALPVYVAIVLLSIVLYRETARALRLPVQTGPEGMKGIDGIALTDIRSEGIVRVRGEIWKAVSREPIGEGQKIRVLRVEGIRAVVERAPVPEVSDAAGLGLISEGSSPLKGDSRDGHVADDGR